ncbi:MAG TPA: aminotransferase class V-fold PLP-dependent enzyme, partial [Pseudomonadales bacterium]|nr:aminotransferase class V-fold PLP-dependent enzyme [Pseudomonadales bacterium]
GMGEAFRIAKEEMGVECSRIAALRDRLWQGISSLDAVHLNGHAERHVCGILNVSFACVEGESLLMSLKDLAVSSGTACTSASLEPSYVLRALGLSDELAHSSFRFSIGRFTTEQEIDHAIEQVRKAVTRLRELSPLWEMHQSGVDLSTVQWAAH